MVDLPEKKFYLDCEFDGHNGPLLSIALVSDDSDIYITTDVIPEDPWVKEHVQPVMSQHLATELRVVKLHEVGQFLREFIGKTVTPLIIADSPVDVGRFCQAWSTGYDGNWMSDSLPRLRFEVINIDAYPTIIPMAVRHNAWWDALALRQALRPKRNWRPIDEAPQEHGFEAIVLVNGREMKGEFRVEYTTGWETEYGSWISPTHYHVEE